MSETEKKARKKPTHRRKGPPCPACGRSLLVSSAPKTPEEIAKLEARVARDVTRVAAAKGATVTELKKPE